MSSKIQNKLDQETLSPVVAIFLMFLLQMAGLLERDEEVEAEEDSEKESLELALQTDSQFIPEAQPFRLEHMPYPIPPAPLLAPSPLQYIQVSSPMVEATLVMPDGVSHVTVIPEMLTVTWHYSDGRAKTQAMRECATEMTVMSLMRDWCPDTPLHISITGGQRSYNYDWRVSRLAGLCTPSRNMITAADFPRSIEGEWIN